MNNSQDCEMIFEAYAKRVLQEADYGPLVKYGTDKLTGGLSRLYNKFKGGNKPAALPANSSTSRSGQLATTPQSREITMPGNNERAIVPTKPTSPTTPGSNDGMDVIPPNFHKPRSPRPPGPVVNGELATPKRKFPVGPMAGAAAAGGALAAAALDKRENVPGPPSGIGTTTVGTTLPTTSSSSSYSPKPKPQGFDSLQPQVGTINQPLGLQPSQYNPISPQINTPNAIKQAQLSPSRKAPIKTKPAATPAPAATNDNPPGTMLSRGLSRLGKGLGNLKFKSPDREMFPYGGAGGTGAAMSRPTTKPSYKPLFSKGGVFNR